ncbi:ABC transporter substrate-binding protein [Falsiroseomonas oryziterrae]|uniref:ABC transporter substrate-binding protein n=1 Tax=Falsiroseomonas oryziterrae TaxID=2911368 RepID=UPI001F2DC6EC|nr:ABC transporter substrate-binding protein [Roseomonas sp. NPKOSM-4]
MRHLRLAAETCRFLPPARVTDAAATLTLQMLVFEPLLRWTDGGRVVPALFSHWDVEEDGRRWTFHIRDGARFHDGVAVEAQHVLDTIEGILGSVDMFGMKWSYSRYLRDARITAPTRTSLRVENPEPFADILDVLAEFVLVRADAAGAPVLGTGPYRVESFVPEQSADLRRVGDTPGPERITVLATPGHEARIAALVAGEVDVGMQLEREAANEREAALEWGRGLNGLSVMHYLNCFEGAFASPEARLAINLAVDRQAILDGLLHGLGVLSATVVSPLHMGGRAAELSPLPYDPERAKRLFEAARVSGPLTLRTPLTLPERAKEVTEAVAEALNRCGVATRIEVQADRPEYAREVGRKVIGDVAIFDSSPRSTFRVLDDKISSANRAVWWQGYHDEEVQRLITAANRTVGDEARDAAYAAVLRRLHANPPWLYLWHPIETFAARPGAGRFSLEGTGILRIEA